MQTLNKSKQIREESQHLENNPYQGVSFLVFPLLSADSNQRVVPLQNYAEDRGLKTHEKIRAEDLGKGSLKTARL